MIKSLLMPVLLLSAACALAAPPGQSGDETVPERRSMMNNERLGALIERIDPKADGRAGFWRLTIREREVLVITDERADRMRVISGVTRAGELAPDLLHRILQANFDTALDARYAIAKEILWSVYVHPLAAMEEQQFVSALAQVVNLALSFGSTFSSGTLSFGGGDSNELLQELRDRLNAI